MKYRVVKEWTLNMKLLQNLLRCEKYNVNRERLMFLANPYLDDRKFMVENMILVEFCIPFAFALQK